MSVPMRFETATMKRVNNPTDMPPKGFVIQFHDIQTVHHEGDERSRTNPGHGYPAYSEQFLMIEQYVTTDESEWKRAIWSLLVVDKTRRDFVAFQLSRAEIKTTVDVEIT